LRTGEGSEAKSGAEREQTGAEEESRKERKGAEGSRHEQRRSRREQREIREILAGEQSSSSR
jgi:hypothetical protein